MNVLLELFTQEELDTAVPIENVCPFCKKHCGNLFVMKDCENKICGNCFDDFYDNYQLGGLKQELFKCFCCDKNIYDFKVE